MTDFLLSDEHSRRHCIQEIYLAQDGAIVKIKHPNQRSNQANALMWCLLNQLAKKPWHGRRMTADDYKNLITAGLKGQDSVPNANGDGFVTLGAQTREMSDKEISEVIEMCHLVAGKIGVRFLERGEKVGR